MRMRTCLFAILTSLASVASFGEAAATTPSSRSRSPDNQPEPPPLYIAPDVKGYQASLIKREYWLRYYASPEQKQAAGRDGPLHRFFHSKLFGGSGD